ncbi:MAG: type II secretion system F family protein [Sterolibacterium sp.]|nr:type II secretion system F family protein [Sterolibacterium sp.]MBP9799546.1 type II secretion system F family protein [Sterolibacterium sp.]
MTVFTYHGRSADGKVSNGVIEADSAGAAAAVLQGRSIIPVSITAKGGGRARPAAGKDAKGTNAKDAKEGKGNIAAGITLADKDLFPQPVNHLDVMMFSRQIYTLLKAGVPIMRALAGLQESEAKPAMRTMLQELRDNLDAGRDLSVSLARQPKIFTSFYVSMVRVGEMTGQLESVFLRLYDHMSFERFMKEQVSSALRYPMFVIIAMAVALVVVNIFVIPAFSKVFASYKAELPIMTKILLGFSAFMVTWWPALLAAVAGMIVAFKSWVKTPIGHYQWDKTKLSLPVAGKIVRKATLARFARSYALSSKSGVPIIQALSTVAQTVDNEYFSRKVESMREGVERGESLLRVSIQAGIFTPVVLQMIAVGEESGTVDDLMQEIAEMYQGEIEYELKTLTQQIEPILIVMLAIMVLILALGIFLPMWDMGKVAMNK